MIIHSKERDYYDTTNPWRTDFHWVRKSSKEILDIKLVNEFWSIKGITRYDDVFIVGFCGKLYTGIKYHNIDTREYYYEYKNIKQINSDWLLKYFKDMPLFLVIMKGWSKVEFIKNPVLANWEFYRVKDAYTTHQELESFLTNELANQLDGVELEETERQVLLRHGMDKWSFKKRKKFDK